MTDAAREIAQALDARGLRVPARLLADAHRPLGPLLSDLGVMAAPLLRMARGSVAAAADLVERPDALDRLLDALDEDDRDADAR